MANYYLGDNGELVSAKKKKKKQGTTYNLRNDGTLYVKDEEKDSALSWREDEIAPVREDDSVYKRDDDVAPVKETDWSSVYAEATRLQTNATNAKSGLNSKKGKGYNTQKASADAEKEKLNSFLEQYGFKNINELKSAYNGQQAQKEEEKKADALNKKWGKYMSASDYSTLSVTGESKIVKDGKWWEAKSDDKYDFINDINGHKNKVESGSAAVGDTEKYGAYTKYDYMTDDEKGLYNYIYAKEGKDKANEFLKDIDGYLEARYGQELHETRSTMQKALYWLPGGLENWSQGVKQFFSEDQLPATHTQIASSLIKTEAYENSNLLGNLYMAGESASQQIPNILLTRGVSSAASGLGVGVSAATKIGQTAGTVGMFTSSAGNAYGQALEEGKSKEEARTYSTIVGALEAGLQTAMGGISALGGVSESAIMGKVALIENTALRMVSKYGLQIGAEIAEEELQLWLEPLVRATVFEEEYDAPTFKEMVETAFTTAISTGVLNATSNISEGTKVNGMTVGDAKVVDKLYKDAVAEAEKDGKKLSSKEKSKIREDIVERMDKGDISIDTIEEVLGGKTYEEYKNLTDNENALKSELDELRGMKSGDRNDFQDARMNELKGMNLDDTTKRDALKTKLYDEVYGIAKNGRLVESYNEKARRGQAFEADLKQYTGKQRESVERAIKSGVLNNTNKAHALVDTLSKIEAEKGIIFDYADNKKLKELGFSLEGKTINGFESGGTVTLNVQSAKSWQSTVGHEIGHVLEGTEHYGALQEVLFKHAESKGELESRRATLTELYKGIDADIDKELTADLIGDYLFEDKAFINKLTGNRTLFQKVYDEIKYLYKVATGKDKTEIEKVKEEFDKVWNEFNAESVKTDGKVNYSVSGVNAKTTDKSKLYDAMRRTAFGEDAETVRKDTGWYKGKDNKWRFYIPDNAMEVVGSIGTNNSAMLGDYIEHHKLFAAYPDLKNINVRFSNLNNTKNGEYSPQNNEIVLNNRLLNGDIEKLKNTLVHEIQHAIQHIEGFAVGGNRNTGFVYALNMAYDKTKNSPEFGRLKNKTEKYEHIVSVAKNLFNANNENELQYKAYRNLYGEVESRQVAQNRLFDEDLLRLATPDTSGNVINPEHEIKKAIDNFTKIGYTEKEIISLLEGVRDDKSGSVGDIEGGSQRNENFGMLQRGQLHLGIPTSGIDGTDGGNQGASRDNGQGIYTDTPKLSNTEGLGGRVTTDNTNETAPIQEASSEGDVFFDGKKFSLSPETDNTYLSAVAKGDTETAQRIVEETANSLGYSIRAYHGTARGDRVGNVFLPERATSGPMAFFTSDKQIAENYARDKKDTSLAYDEEYNDYFTQFRVQKNGKSISITDLWSTLSATEKANIKEKAPHITLDENSENIIYNPNNKYGLGAFDAYRINENNGNYLKALIDEWLVDGNLWGEEHRFLEVLKFAGLENVEYRDPDAKHEKVYDTFLKIEKPFDTANVDEDFITDLESWYDAQDQSKYEVESNQADLWDKNSRDAYDFAERLRDDLASGKSFAWTSIPDAVTDYLKSKGYDGIKDTGGKSGGDEHIVYIPFSSEQIKSAEPITYDDNGNVIPLSERFNPDNEDIRYSLSKQGEQIAPIGNYSTPLNETALAPIRENVATTTKKQLADNIAPITEAEANALQDELFNNITDVDAPPEVETMYDDVPDTSAIDDKTLKNIGKSLRETLSLTAEETKAIQEIVQEYSTSETPNAENLFETIKDKFGEKVWRIKNEHLAEVKRFLRNSKIKISPQIKSDIADFGDFRKRLGGKIGTSKDGLPVDSAYRELVELFPAYFSEDIWNPTDQFLKMAEVASTDLYMQDSAMLDDETIQEAVNIILDEVSGYKDNLTRIAAEETAKEALDAIAPLRAEQLASGTRGDALLNESLDNFPIKTVEDMVAEKIRAEEGKLADLKVLRSETIANIDNEVERLSNEYMSKKDKNTQAANKIVTRISRLQGNRAKIDADYAKRISDLEARLERMNDPTYSRAMHKQAKMQEHAKWAADLLGDTSTWKDKKIGLQYATNTERRNLRDIVRDENGNKDIARADEIDDALNGQYNREEAAKKRELAQIRGKYAELKITKAEDTYAQMLGELRHNPDTSLTEEDVTKYYEKHKNKIDTEKVEKIITLARQDYDNLLNRVNEKLREQGMKEIPYRQGYFPHFTEPKQNFIQKLLNWKTQDNEIPTSIAGLTETFRPVKSYQSFDKTRYSDETDYSFAKGFDSYSDGALDWIYHLDTLQKRRATENHIRFTHSDEGIKARIKEVYADEGIDANEAQAQIEHILAEAENPLNNFIQDFTTHTNILAGKKNSLDRTVEQWTNRHIYSVMTNVQNRMSANMVLANVRSALTNFIPITQSWAQVSPLRSLQATKDTIANAIKDDGMIDKSTFLTNRLREVDNLYNTAWDKVLDKAGIMFEVIDNFSSQVIWRSKYNQNIANDMTESEAIANADQFAENVMAGRSKGNEPTLFNAKNPFVKAFTMFQLEVNNQYGYLFKDAPNDLKAETEHWKFNLAKGYTTAFIGAYVYNELLSTLTGSDAALDPIGIIEDLLKDLGLFDDDEEEKEPSEIVTNLVDNVVEELPFVGGLFGGGRIPISSALPYGGEYGGGLEGAIKDVTEGNWGNIGKEMMAPILNIGLPVGGGQFKKSVQGLKMFDTNEDHPIAGSYTDSGALRFPVDDTIGNRIQAGIFGQYANKNAREYFDNNYAPLKEKQIQEYSDVDLPIADYWKYREGLKGLKKNSEKADYINSLDIEDWQKNLLMNNILDRKEDVDMSNYEDFSDFEEFDYAQKNPEKYEFFKANGISYSDYANADEDGKAAYTWAYNNPEKFTVSKVVADDVVKYRSYTSDLYDIKADKDAYGDTIVGSGKEKKAEYINNLDLEYGQKIILFKMQYKSDDTYNADIVEYLNNRDDLTYEERVTIYTELGFTVQDGYVYWD